MKKSAYAKIAALPTNVAVEAYIAGMFEPEQTKLRRLREIIRSEMPAEATEVISYGIPAFALPKPFFGYAAFTNHLSILPFSGSFFNDFAQELAPYSRTKSSLHLPFDKPLPVALIRKLVRARLATLPRAAKKKLDGPAAV